MTSSFDGNVHVWDTRFFSKPVTSVLLDLSGAGKANRAMPAFSLASSTARTVLVGTGNSTVVETNPFTEAQFVRT